MRSLQIPVQSMHFHIRLPVMPDRILSDWQCLLLCTRHLLVRHLLHSLLPAWLLWKFCHQNLRPMSRTLQNLCRHQLLHNLCAGLVCYQKWTVHLQSWLCALRNKLCRADERDLPVGLLAWHCECSLRSLHKRMPGVLEWLILRHLFSSELYNDNNRIVFLLGQLHTYIDRPVHSESCHCGARWPMRWKTVHRSQQR